MTTALFLLGALFCSPPLVPPPMYRGTLRLEECLEQARGARTRLLAQCADATERSRRLCSVSAERSGSRYVGECIDDFMAGFGVAGPIVLGHAMLSWHSYCAGPMNDDQRRMSWCTRAGG
jgi:hypothetical protein